MKKAIIFHGTDGTPDDFWYNWVAEGLRARGYEVSIPAYPDINKEPIGTFLPKVLQAHVIDEETLLIGHSAGVPLILALLEHVKCGQALMAAGFSEPYDGVERDPILQDSYRWDTIKSNCANLVFINSDDDPWGCDDVQGRTMFDHLGGTQVICHEGHFGSHGAKQEFPTFPLLLRLAA
ncbi:MAG TPA: alpha/beta hydrolase [Bacillota bacterium]|nr:alpha/beta hydrolase [Bacillota bacterium]